MPICENDCILQPVGGLVSREMYEVTAAIPDKSASPYLGGLYRKEGFWATGYRCEDKSVQQRDGGAVACGLLSLFIRHAGLPATPPFLMYT